MRHLGYGLAGLTILAMLVQAIISEATGHPDADDLWAYAVFAGLPATVALALGIRGNRSVGWVFLVSAFVMALAAERGLITHWGYAAAFVLATVLTQIAPAWREPALNTRGKAPDEG